MGPARPNADEAVCRGLQCACSGVCAWHVQLFLTTKGAHPGRHPNHRRTRSRSGSASCAGACQSSAGVGGEVKICGDDWSRNDCLVRVSCGRRTPQILHSRTGRTWSCALGFCQCFVLLCAFRRPTFPTALSMAVFGRTGGAVPNPSSRCPSRLPGRLG